jgi:N-acetylmuramoyl-L-alanine amidase
VSRKIEKAPIMSIYCKPLTLKPYSVFIIVIIAIISGLATHGDAKTSPFDKFKKTIVLDPGHGGRDSGAKGPDGSLEKTVALSLAQLIKDQLEKRYKVVLTRTEDYWLDIPGRTDAANHLDSDLFISIHTGGSFLHQAGGISIFHYKDLSRTNRSADSGSSKSFDSDTMISWDNIQSKHMNSSGILAKLIQSRINEHITFSGCKIQAAPLLVLRGADMPAVLIEFGYLTNPAEEKALQNPEILHDFATAVGNGVDDFFQTLEP